MSNMRPKLQRTDIILKHFNVFTVFVHIKRFILKINNYFIVNLLNLRNIPIQILKLLHTL